ncbi:hypothetical protein I4U23_004269 [Adineta vaga]|nr:hypothetical protein I4U23_004269 [Adineta vaga]
MALAHFQSIEIICETVIRVAKNELSIFLNSTFISTSMIEYDVFQKQIDATMVNFKTNSLSSNYLLALELIRAIYSTNAFISAFGTNWFPVIREVRHNEKIYMRPQEYNRSSCNCATSTTCVQTMTLKRKSEPLWPVPGMLSGCLPLDSMLESTMECLYDQTCLDMIIKISYGVIQYGITPGGFSSAPKGWNSFPMQSLGMKFNQENVIKQCDQLVNTLGGYGYDLCSLDSGWSVGAEGDEYGRIIYDSSIFNIPQLADYLHSKNLKLGIYVVPGYFANDVNKFVFGTNYTLSQIGNGHNNGLARIDLNYSHPGAQLWCNSVVDQFAQWGVDMIKLDYVTPGSPDNGVNLLKDNSGIVVCYHNAIAQQKRPIRLGISWKLSRDEPYYTIWSANADTIRTDQDLNGAPGIQTQWSTVQRAIEQYREYMVQVSRRNITLLTLYPDMDNLFVGNNGSRSGLTNTQRQTVMSHWIGAGANLIIGSNMTELDDYGLALLTNKRALYIANNFTSKYPMFPTQGNNNPSRGRQGQMWIAGPTTNLDAAVILVANYGNSGNNNLFDPVPIQSWWSYNFTFSDFGLVAQTTYAVENVWDTDADFTARGNEIITGTLQDSEVKFWRVTKLET